MKSITVSNLHLGDSRHLDYPGGAFTKYGLTVPGADLQRAVSRGAGPDVERILAGTRAVDAVRLKIPNDSGLLASLLRDTGESALARLVDGAKRFARQPRTPEEACRLLTVVYDAKGGGMKIQKWRRLWRTGDSESNDKDVARVVHLIEEITKMQFALVGSNKVISAYMPQLARILCRQVNIVGVRVNPTGQEGFPNAFSGLLARRARLTGLGEEFPAQHPLKPYFKPISGAVSVLGHEMFHALLSTIFLYTGGHLASFGFGGQINESTGDAGGLLAKQLIAWSGGVFAGLSPSRMFGGPEDFGIGDDWLRLADGVALPLRNALDPDNIVRGDEHPFRIQGQPPSWRGFLDRMVDPFYLEEHIDDRDGVHSLSSLPILPLAKLIGFFGGNSVPAVQARLSTLVFCAMTGTNDPSPSQWLTFELAAILYEGGLKLEGANVSLPQVAKDAFDAYLKAFKEMGMPHHEEAGTLESVIRFLFDFDNAYQRAMSLNKDGTGELRINIV